MRGSVSVLNSNDFYYYPGQIETIKYFYVPAHHTGSRKEIWLELQLGKSYKYCNSLELQSFKAVTRHSLGGYAFNKVYSDGGYDYLSSIYSFENYHIYKVNDFIFRIDFNYSQPVPIYDNNNVLLSAEGVTKTNNIIFFLDIRELKIKFI